jgi:hypothetical protein
MTSNHWRLWLLSATMLVGCGGKISSDAASEPRMERALAYCDHFAKKAETCKVAFDEAACRKYAACTAKQFKPESLEASMTCVDSLECGASPLVTCQERVLPPTKADAEFYRACSDVVARCRLEAAFCGDVSSTPLPLEMLDDGLAIAMTACMETSACGDIVKCQIDLFNACH